MRKCFFAAVICTLFAVMFLFYFFGKAASALSFPAKLTLASVSIFAVDLAVFILFDRTKEPGKVPADRQGGASAPPPVSEGAGKRGYELFQRMVRYMEEKRPYLDESLNLDDFSRAMYTNKVYVSKNINYYSGKNFRQFINWYRIRYAKELMMQDPHLKMEEVSTMSGFHSTVSFNMAFRLFEEKTPTGWLEEYIDSKKKL